MAVINNSNVKDLVERNYGPKEMKGMKYMNINFCKDQFLRFSRIPKIKSSQKFWKHWDHKKLNYFFEDNPAEVQNNEMLQTMKRELMTALCATLNSFDSYGSWN